MRAILAVSLPKAVTIKLRNNQWKSCSAARQAVNPSNFIPCGSTQITSESSRKALADTVNSNSDATSMLWLMRELDSPQAAAGPMQAQCPSASRCTYMRRASMGRPCSCVDQQDVSEAFLNFRVRCVFWLQRCYRRQLLRMASRTDAPGKGGRPKIATVGDGPRASQQDISQTKRTPAGLQSSLMLSADVLPEPLQESR